MAEKIVHQCQTRSEVWKIFDLVEPTKTKCKMRCRALLFCVDVDNASPFMCASWNRGEAQRYSKKQPGPICCYLLKSSNMSSCQKRADDRLARRLVHQRHAGHSALPMTLDLKRFWALSHQAMLFRAFAGKHCIAGEEETQGRPKGTF